MPRPALFAVFLLLCALPVAGQQKASEDPLPKFERKFLSDPAVIQAGKAVWDAQCTHCHGAWKGKYIFGDWSKSFAEMDGQIFIATKSGDKWSMEVAEATNMKGKKPYVLAFAQDEKGEVYALTSQTTGPNGSLDTIYRIVPAQ